MQEHSAEPLPMATTTGVGDAVGVPKRHWFIALVGHNTEKASRDRLARLGYESFVASQDETHVWRNGKKRQIERILISTLLFVRASEAERRQIVRQPYIKAFLTDKAGRATASGARPLAVIPDQQMDMLRFMLYRSDRPVGFVAEPLAVGHHIRVVRGTMVGLEGEVVTVKEGDAPHIGVRIDYLGFATLQVSPDDVERIA